MTITYSYWLSGRSVQEYTAHSLFREVNAEKAKGNIYLHWPTNSVNMSFIALLMNPDNFIKKINFVQQSSQAES